MAQKTLAESLAKVNPRRETSAEILARGRREVEKLVRDFREAHPRAMFPSEVRQALHSIKPKDAEGSTHAVILWTNPGEFHNLQAFCDLFPGRTSVVDLT